MKIKDIINSGVPSLSFEVFPPKTGADFDSVTEATEQITDLYANGLNAVRVYSMNKPDVACAISENLSAVI